MHLLSQEAFTQLAAVRDQSMRKYPPHTTLNLAKTVAISQAAWDAPSADRLCYLGQESIYLRANKPFSLRRAD